MSGDTIWDLTQQFAKRQSTLVARWATTCLLSLYADRLASLRDQAGRRRVASPVREARDFDRYLTGEFPTDIESERMPTGRVLA